MARQILERAHPDRFEPAWRPADLPTVIDAVRDAGLVSLGGDPQFRFPDGSVAELTGHGIDVSCVLDTRHSWEYQVGASAHESAELVRNLCTDSLVRAGWSRFFLAFSDQKSAGHDPADHLYLTWESTGKHPPEPHQKPFSCRDHGLPVRKWLTPDITRKALRLSFPGFA